MRDNNYHSIRKSNLTDHHPRNSIVSNHNSNVLEEDTEYKTAEKLGPESIKAY